MKVKNNYNECITNVACSIRKYFGLNYKHNTIKYLDDLLEQKQPKNVVLILFDGMGSKVLEKTIDENSFLRKNMYKEITTVFPATTCAATYSARTGLNPIEHGYLGWYMYVKPLDDTILLFTGKSKNTLEINPKYEKIREKYLATKCIYDEINEQGKYKAYNLFPFGDNAYKDMDDMFTTIKEKCTEEGKKYIYAYDDKPDYYMHRNGVLSDTVKDIIKDRNDRLEDLCNNLEDSVVIAIADHGHTYIEPIFLEDYPDFVEMLERKTSLEERSISFKLKENIDNKDFINLFNKYFGKWYNLYSKEEIIESHIFGDGKENELYRDAIGDFIAITESNKALLSKEDNVYISHHAGYSDEEIYIPLIIVDKTK